MTCIIKLLNNTPKSICKLGLKKKWHEHHYSKNTAFRTGHMKLFRTGHFSIDGKMYTYPSKISFELNVNTQMSTNHNSQCT